MRKFFKIIGWIIGGILLLVIAAVVVLQLPFGKRFVRDKALSILRNKLKTEVYIGSIDYSLPKMLELNDVLFKDQAKDTLLSAHKLKVDMNMLKLISGKVVIQQVELDGITAHVYRNLPDTSFNYAFIMKAFAGDPNAAKTPTAEEVKKANDTSSSMSFDVDRVLLSNIHVRYDDYTGGSRLGLDLNSLLLQLDKLDPTNMEYGIKKLAIHGLATTYIQDTSYLPPVPKDTTASKPLHLTVGEVTLDDVAVNYDDRLGKMIFNLDLGHLLAKPKEIDLTGERINIDRLDLDSTRVKIAMGKSSVIPAKADSLADTVVNQMNWRVNVANINFKGIDFKMDNDNLPVVKQGIDYGHLDVKNLAIDLEDLLYTSDTISGNLKHLAVQEKSGFDLQELKTNFNYNSHGAVLSDLYVKTDKTLLQNHIQATYPSIAALQQNMQSLNLKIDIQNSYVGMKDVLIFAPQMAAQLGQFRNATLRTDVVLQGFMNNLDISKFYVAGLSGTEISLSGKVTGLPDANKVRYNLNIAKIKSSKRDVSPFLPASIAAQYRIPEVFALTGKVSGTAKDYNTQLVLMTTDGDAYLKGYVYMSPGKNRERYDLYLKTNRLNVGRILKMDTTLGRITMDWAVKGVGFDPKYMTASLKGKIDNAFVKGYNYSQISLKGAIARQKGNLEMASADKNISMNLVAKADLEPKYPAISATLSLDSADFQALKLSATQLKMSTTIVADIPVMNVDYPQATVTLTQTKILSDNKKYLLDSLYVSSKPDADSGQHIMLDLGVLNAMVTGHIPLTRIGDALQDHISKHYSIADSMMNGGAAKVQLANAKKQKTKTVASEPVKPMLGSYDLHITANVKKTPLLTSVVPDLKEMDSVNLRADLDNRNLKVNFSAPTIVYGTNTIKGTKAVVTGEDSGLVYNVSISEFSQPSIKIINTTLHGNANANEITAYLNIQDTNKKDRFALAAAIQQQAGDNVITLRDGLVLDYKTYTVAQPNRIVVGAKGFYADNFKITSGSEVISINSTPATYNAPLNAQISNFILGDITKMFSKGDTLIANGVLSLNATVSQFTPKLLFAADMKVDNLSVRNDTLGTVTANAATQDGNDVAAKLAFDGGGNDIKLAGDYYMTPVAGNSFNFDLNLNAINLKSFEGLAMNQIRNSSGNLRGKFNIQGTADKPKVNGELTTDQLKTTISMINSAFYMPSEKLTIDENGLDFKKFTIQDSAGHKFSIDGEVATTDFKKMELDLKIRADNFRAIHSTEKDNKLFYGDVFISANISVSGAPAAPTVDGNFNINKGTKFSVALPEKEVGLEDHAGIVEFVDKSDLHPDALQPVDSTPKLAFEPGGGINVNIGIDELAEFSVIIDQATGDFLRVRGDASLNASVSPGGDLSLTGIYELKEGGYQLNYNFLKRKFNIKSGSTITFAGDPLDAVADITAIYTANTPPYELVAKQIDDPTLSGYFKQNLPFDILLNMKGKLMEPLITFGIELPEERTYRISSDNIDLIQTKLAQLRTDTSELNKQVFAVLVLNRFVGEDPFNSGMEGGGAAFAAKQSAGRFLSEQLNKYAGSLIKGVDISFDLASTEDYSSGDRRERTDLNIAASKRLLNDRLTVTVGNNFELDGAQSSNSNQKTSVIPGNLSADYKLTQDGRFSTRVYRQTQDQGVIEGFVIETGVKFIMTFDYNRFKNLLNGKKRRRQDAEERKKEQQQDDEKNGKTGFVIDRKEDDFNYESPTNE